MANYISKHTGSEIDKVVDEAVLFTEQSLTDEQKTQARENIGAGTEQVQSDLSQTDSTQLDYVKGVIRQESLPEGYPYEEYSIPILCPDDASQFVYNNGTYTRFYEKPIPEEKMLGMRIAEIPFDLALSRDTDIAEGVARYTGTLMNSTQDMFTVASDGNALGVPAGVYVSPIVAITKDGTMHLCGGETSRLAARFVPRYYIDFVRDDDNSVNNLTFYPSADEVSAALLSAGAEIYAIEKAFQYGMAFAVKTYALCDVDLTEGTLHFSSSICEDGTVDFLTVTLGGEGETPTATITTETLAGADEIVDAYAREQVELKQDKITGTAGQVVGFDANGNAIADKVSWNDLTDKPFYEEISDTILLSEITFSEATMFKGVLTNNFTYVVIFDDIEYQVVATDGYLGNVAIMDESAPNSGEPFFVFSNRYEVFVMAQDKSAEHTISIIEKTEVITPLDIKYLPEEATTNPDWVVNDSTSPAYVANRTHYMLWPEPDTYVYQLADTKLNSITNQYSGSVELIDELVNNTWLSDGVLAHLEGTITITEDGAEAVSLTVNEWVRGYRRGTYSYGFNISGSIECPTNTYSGFWMNGYIFGYDYSPNKAVNGSVDVQLTITGGYVTIDPKYLPVEATAQADWSINDDTDPAFIKNKPFGEENGLVENVILPETILYFSNIASSGGPINCGLETRIPFTDTVASGDRCVVTVSAKNGTNEAYNGTYECVAFTENGSILIGDKYYWYDCSGEHTAELPFCFCPETETGVGKYGSYAIEIAKLEEGIVTIPIDEKYIPDTIARQSDVDIADWDVNDETSPAYVKNRTHWTTDPVEVVVLEEQTVTIDEDGGRADLSGQAFLTEGQKYTVNFNGTTYECVAWKYELGTLIGNGEFLNSYNGNGEPFCIWGSVLGFNDPPTLAANSAGTYTISITTIQQEVVKIPEKYLPKLVGKDVTGTEYTIEGSVVIAKENAEVFNNYLDNIASGHYSHAEGNSTTASGYVSHAEGYETTASGGYSHAEGCVTTASGNDGSHAEGYKTTASGYGSHAEGYETTASGRYGSHAEGWGTTASGYGSHAEGYETTASSRYSHAEGNNTIANSKSQHVQGEYNILDTENLEARSTYVHIVGNGSSSARSNAHTLDWDGNAWFAGDVYVGSTSGTNKDEGSKKLQTELVVTDDGAGNVVIS